MTKPKISIVTPSFNQAEFLEQCICSVLDQNYANLEYIIIDGGSTDKSVEIIKKYEKYLSFWVSERDQGQSDAINKGWRRATGDIMAWINSDDFYLPHSFDLAAEFYQQYPQASFYFGHGYRVDKAGNIISSFFPPGNIVHNQQLLLLGLNYILQPSTFINKKYLLQANYLNTALHYTMDFDLWLRLAKLADPIFIPEFLAAGREYETTKTSTGSFERMEEMRRLVEKQCGMAITPGVLWYFLCTLKDYCATRPDVFPDTYTQAVETFEIATAELLKPLGGRPDGFPFSECSLYGLYPDGMTTHCVGMSYGKKQWGGFVEITLAAPPSLPSAEIHITVKYAKKRLGRSNVTHFVLPRGEGIAIRQPLSRRSNRIEFLIDPVFQPKALGTGDDIRRLGCLCTSFKLITKEGERELLNSNR